MKRHIRSALSLVILAGALAMAGGCGNEPDDYSYGKRTVKQNAIKPLNRISPDGKAMPHDQMRSSEAKPSPSRINHEQLARIAAGVSGVNHAIAVMNETDVLVGIEVTGNKRIVEKRVMSTLSRQYPEYRYHITASDELRERIKAVGNRQGKGYRPYMLNQDIGVLADAIDVSSVRP
ncbi:hypothetical protein D3P09_07525 [Paenibacillus pinisoli]|uniref:YhcN/YlaJ family sporulation lipoprotein n=1 Tax=Paenibacillus pinisoli TaxID=1276110 RepID=A0A3A6PRI1_9BACL|nr:hypothetical protein [Paenibacillus pinisoli]RJX39291.1 hypothetical protein D3P09_07525 [Paenibacillus pinisoli]